MFQARYLLHSAVAIIINSLFFCFVLDCGTWSYSLYDSDQYLSIARSLLNGQGFFESEHGWYAYRLPGYSLFLTAAMSLVGQNLKYVLLLQIIVLSFLPCMVVVLARQFFPKEPFLYRMVGVLSLVWIPFILYAGFFVTEGIFTVVFVAWLISLKNFLKSHLWAAATGFLLGILSLIRPVGVPLLILVLVGGILRLVFCSWQEPLKSILSKHLFFIGAWGLTVLPWLIRNFLMFGAVFFHTLPGKHFLQYSASNVYAAVNECSYLEARKILFKQVDEEAAMLKKNCNIVLNEYQESVLCEKAAMRVMFGSPWHTIKDCFINWCKTLVMLHLTPIVFAYKGWPEYTSTTSLIEKIKFYITPISSWVSWLIYLEMLQILFFGFLILASCVAYLRGLLAAEIFWLAILISGLFVFLTLSYSCARLRTPIEPIVMVVGLYSMLQLYRQRRLKD